MFTRRTSGWVGRNSPEKRSGFARPGNPIVPEFSGVGAGVAGAGVAGVGAAAGVVVTGEAANLGAVGMAGAAVVMGAVDVVGDAGTVGVVAATDGVDETTFGADFAEAWPFEAPAFARAAALVGVLPLLLLHLRLVVAAEEQWLVLQDGHPPLALLRGGLELVDDFDVDDDFLLDFHFRFGARRIERAARESQADGRQQPMSQTRVSILLHETHDALLQSFVRPARGDSFASLGRVRRRSCLPADARQDQRRRATNRAA